MQSKHPSKIWIFVPCFNVAGLVVPTLKRIPKNVLDRVDKVLVVDNNSDDGTDSLVLQFVEGQSKFSFYQNKKNYSLGGSTVLAFDKAIANQVDYLICLHSDGQAPPEQLQDFINAIDSGESYDFILGSRFLNESECDEYSRLRLYANHIFAWIQQFILKQRVYDLGSYIAFNMQTIKQLAYNRVISDMGYHPNLILTAAKTLKRPLRFFEFPIAWGKVEVSHVNIWEYGIKHLSRLIRFIVTGAPLLSEPLNIQSQQIK